MSTSNPTTAAPETERLLTAKEVSVVLGLATGTIYNLRSAGRFAPAILLGNAVRWERDDVLEWARQFKEGRTVAQKAVAALKAVA